MLGPNRQHNHEHDLDHATGTPCVPVSRIDETRFVYSIPQTFENSFEKTQVISSLAALAERDVSCTIVVLIGYCLPVTGKLDCGYTVLRPLDEDWSLLCIL